MISYRKHHIRYNFQSPKNPKSIIPNDDICNQICYNSIQDMLINQVVSHNGTVYLHNDNVVDSIKILSLYNFQKKKKKKKKKEEKNNKYNFIN